MRLRIIAVGALELVISIVLYAIRGFHTAYLGLLGVGVLLIVLGLFWR